MLRERDFLMNRERETSIKDREWLRHVEEEGNKKDDLLLIERKLVRSLEVEKARLIEEHRIEKEIFVHDRERLLTALLDRHQSRSSPPLNNNGSKHESEIPEELRITVKGAVKGPVVTDTNDEGPTDGSTLPAVHLSRTTDQSYSSIRGSRSKSMVHWRRRLVMGGLLEVTSDVGWATYTKLMLEFKVAVLALPVSFIVCVLFVNDNGIVDLLSHWTQ